ncbi:BRCA1-A complex subunit RAP80 isoform X2 [Tachyglossus aculeatus]|uniref:BRCA1-A complex subunit RAP80 isoform X2 n=1 Tax=Tachyglossus aculeatus TaxID=9261 RepID=UPI0018F3A620|nr:BRCA1-A complex subunit RAP80 isoform X2 [Tachyglossus aculeatus]
MPRKKKKVADSPEVQNTEEDEKEPDAVVHVRKKRSFADAFIVISDSDGEEPKEENGLPRTKTRQQVERAKCSAKRKISQMTEEEQFALALQMSEQEARQANSQEEEEEELLRKAIAESLNSCQPSGSFDGPGTHKAPSPDVGDNPADPGLERDRPTRPESPRSPARSRESPGGGGGAEVPRSPLVVLKRLSQDIVESSLTAGIVVSPGRDRPPPGCGDDAPSPTFGGCGDGGGPGPRSRLAPSPTFPRSAGSPWQLAPRKLFGGRRGGGEGTPERSPDPSGRLDVGPAPGGPEGQDRPSRPAPGVRKAEASRRRSRHLPGDPEGERSAEGCGDARRSPGDPPAAGTAPTLHPRRLPGPADAPGPQQEDGGSVHYYWGVPFCPAGVDPDQYTRVILCQLEAYQKSLKLAQRQLLRKRAFGEPVVPGPPARGDRDREPQAAPEEAGDGDSENSGGAGAAAWCPQSGEPPESPTRDQQEQEGAPSEDEATTSHCQASQGLFDGDPPEEGETRQITHSPTTWMPLTNAKSPAAAPGSPPEDVTVCPETQLSPPKACDLEREEEEAYSVDREPVPQAGSPEEEQQEEEKEEEEAAAWRPRVTCPLCDRCFPPSTIQRHAMNCEGFLEKQESRPPPVLTRSRREPRGRSDDGRDAHPPPDIDKREKCYLCRSLVPFTDYRRHVDSCLRTVQADPLPDGPGKSRRPKSGKEGARKEGRLLSLLEQSETKASDAEGKLGSSVGGAFRLLSGTEEEDGGVAAGPSWEGRSRLSPPDLNDDDSPIKSFVSISEATDCLVDFKKQLSIRPGGRAQTRAGRGRRRKS